MPVLSRFRAFPAVFRANWIPIMLLVFVVAVFASAPFVALYRNLRARVPGAAGILPPK